MNSVPKRFFIAGGGCYGTFYLRQLDRARDVGKVSIKEIVVVDNDPRCQAADLIKGLTDTRLEVCNWLDFGKQVMKNRTEWAEDHWVPTPLGPHILYHWAESHLLQNLGVKLKPTPYAAELPPLPYAHTAKEGTLVLSHAPGLCPTHCVEPKLCPLTKAHRDWEMKDTVKALIKDKFPDHGISEVAVFLCQHYKHAVGTVTLKNIFDEIDLIEKSMLSGAKRMAAATVSSCHGIVDIFDLEKV